MVLRATPEKREEKVRVRQALLRAALRLGAEHGFASLGLREVSRAASIAPTSFYRHFADMGELGSALVMELVRPMVRTLAESALQADASVRAEKLFEGILAAVVADAELARFLVAERVGAFANLRQALNAELEVFATLHAAPKAGPLDLAAREVMLIGATVAVLVEGFARTLDAPAGERAQLRERLVGSLALALGQRAP
jgi:TetR/AcrR family transcriptional regulator, fatty acid biosynthesis regulator